MHHQLSIEINISPLYASSASFQCMVGHQHFDSQPNFSSTKCISATYPRLVSHGHSSSWMIGTTLLKILGAQTGCSRNNSVLSGNGKKKKKKRKIKKGVQEEHHDQVCQLALNAEYLKLCMTFNRMLSSRYGQFEFLG